MLHQNTYESEPRHVANRLLMAELIRRGHGVEKIGQVLLADVNGCVVFFKQAYTSLFSNTASKLISNKFATKIVLEANGINVARGGIYSSSAKNDAWKMAESLGSSVIKPFNGARGKGVSVGIKSKAGFESAWKYAGGDEGRSQGKRMKNRSTTGFAALYQ